MPHADTQYMHELEDELQLVLAGISPERRLRGLAPEELAGGLTEEQAVRLRELLDRRQDG